MSLSYPDKRAPDYSNIHKLKALVDSPKANIGLFGIQYNGFIDIFRNLIAR
jgi:hypothetical protein